MKFVSTGNNSINVKFFGSHRGLFGKPLTVDRGSPFELPSLIYLCGC